MKKLNLVANTLLDLVTTKSDDARVADAATPDLLQESGLRALEALVESVGKYMSPFLERIILTITRVSPIWRTTLLEGIGRTVVTHVPHRLLLPAVQSAVATVARAAVPEAPAVQDGVNQFIEMQRIAALQLWLFSSAPPEFVSDNAATSTASLLQIFASGIATVAVLLRCGTLQAADFCARFLPGGSIGVHSGKLIWSEHCSQGHLGRLNALGSAAFAQLALRLSFDELRPYFGKVVDWARNAQPQVLALQVSRKAASVEASDVARDAEDACRALALLAILRGLVAEAPDLAEELLLPATTRDIMACLVAARRYALQLAQNRGAAAGSKKRQRAGLGVSRSRNQDVLQGSTWWWLEVFIQALGFIGDALGKAGSKAVLTKPVEEALDQLREPCANTLDVFEFLPAVDDNALPGTLLEATEKALVSLTAASDSAGVKKLLYYLLSKTRSEDAEVRLCAVKACHRIWKDLGVQAVSGLSEVVMFAAELLEDEDPRVETAVRAMIKTMEDCTGESLQESLKQ